MRPTDKRLHASTCFAKPIPLRGGVAFRSIYVEHNRPACKSCDCRRGGVAAALLSLRRLRRRVRPFARRELLAGAYVRKGAYERLLLRNASPAPAASIRAAPTAAIPAMPGPPVFGSV